jgi:hypothetical protein
MRIWLNGSTGSRPLWNGLVPEFFNATTRESATTAMRCRADHAGDSDFIKYIKKIINNASNSMPASLIFPAATLYRKRGIATAFWSPGASVQLRHANDTERERLRQRELLNGGCAVGFPYSKERLAGCGIVICGSGAKYLPSVYVLMRPLRHLWCRLSVRLHALCQGIGCVGGERRSASRRVGVFVKPRHLYFSKK